MATYPVPAPRRTAVVLPNPQSNTIVPQTQPERVADDNGITKVRSGQVLGVSFFSAIQSSYQNLVYHPIAFTLLVLSLMILYVPPKGNDVFIVAVRKSIEARKKAYSTSAFASVPAFISFIIKLIEGYAIQLANVLLTFIPYIVKPSNRNLCMALILGFFMWLRVPSSFELIMYTQLFYLYVMMRSPTHRLIVASVFLVIVLSSFFHVVDSSYVLKGSGVTPPTTTTENGGLKGMREGITVY